MKKTKIIATIGPASENKEILIELIKAGVDTIRLNMSHGEYEQQLEKVRIVRKINEKLNTSVAVLLDTKGPEVRTGLFENGKALLTKGEEVIITMDEVLGTSEKFTVTYKGLKNDLKSGNIILLDDGYVSIIVKEIRGNDIHCEVLNTGMMKDRRGVNVPGVTLNFEFMSSKDKADIIWACENDFEFIAASFVRNARDAQEIRKVIKGCGNKRIQLIAKIESQDGVENFEEILVECDGIMIARGDLGVEVAAEDVPVIQANIIKKCNEAGKIVITATQMLESMQTNPRPTRAEVSDVFNAVLNGTDAVMLSGETAAGDYPIEAVSTQATIVEKAEGSFDYDKYIREIHRHLDSSIEEVVAFSVASTSAKVKGCKLIIAITNSGATAKKISRMKPSNPILAITHSEEVRKTLALNYGIVAVSADKKETLDEALDDACEIAKKMNLVIAGDVVVISAGSIEGKGNTDLMKVRVLN